ncbi:hypothetical protein HYX58_06185 [Candidatus Dependentiae bacterium]|nr:hypothetical protein [Candidatus Dependentiae bacterium]
MRIKLLALFLIWAFQTLAMDVNEPVKTIDPQDINQLSQLTSQGKYFVKECLNDDFRACEELQKEPQLMRQIKAQHPQMAAGLYLQMKKAKKYNNDKLLIETYLKERKACFEKKSPSGCDFILKHQKALADLKVLNGAQLDQAKDTIAHMHCPFFSE